MTAPSALAGLPGGGVFPLDFSEGFRAAAKGRQAGVKGDAMGLRYSFKPASSTSSSAGEIEMDKGQPKVLSFETRNGTSQVFDVREETSKARECVLIWNPETASLTLSPLGTTLNLTLNRNLSSQQAKPKTKRKSSTDEPASHPAPEQVQREQKKPRPSEAKAAAPAPAPASAPAARPTKGGKGLPRKSLPAAATAAMAQTKFKSAEVIEDSESGSDNEAEVDGGADGEEEEEEAPEEMDEFASMLARELSGDPEDDESAAAAPAPAPAPVLASASAPVDVFDDSSESDESSSDWEL